MARCPVGRAGRRPDHRRHLVPWDRQPKGRFGELEEGSCGTCYVLKKFQNRRHLRDPTEITRLPRPTGVTCKMVVFLCFCVVVGLVVRIVSLQSDYLPRSEREAGEPKRE